MSLNIDMPPNIVEGIRTKPPGILAELELLLGVEAAGKFILKISEVLNYLFAAEGRIRPALPIETNIPWIVSITV